jgi:nucleoside-diphosphate-sugar epimerase
MAAASLDVTQPTHRGYVVTGAAGFIGGHVSEFLLKRGEKVIGIDMVQEAINRRDIDWQEKIHRGILRGLRNISDTP